MLKNVSNVIFSYILIGSFSVCTSVSCMDDRDTVTVDVAKAPKSLRIIGSPRENSPRFGREGQSRHIMTEISPRVVAMTPLLRVHASQDHILEKQFSELALSHPEYPDLSRSVFKHISKVVLGVIAAQRSLKLGPDKIAQVIGGSLYVHIRSLLKEYTQADILAVLSHQANLLGVTEFVGAIEVYKCSEGYKLLETFGSNSMNHGVASLTVAGDVHDMRELDAFSSDMVLAFSDDEAGF